MIGHNKARRIAPRRTAKPHQNELVRTLHRDPMILFAPWALFFRDRASGTRCDARCGRAWLLRTGGKPAAEDQCSKRNPDAWHGFSFVKNGEGLILFTQA
jgi:hypothetical protein